MAVGIVERGERVLLGSYRRQPVAIVRGEGVHVWDEGGRRYLDLLGGIATVSLGHCHPAVVAALEAQARRLWHASNVYATEPQVALAERLVARSFADRVFFCNSGAEANEAAIKLARRHAHVVRGEAERSEIVCAEGSFHGRTLGALAATGQPKYHEGFEPLPAGFAHVPFGDAAALDRAVGRRTAAVLLEPIQGESGVRVPPPGYLARVREICDRAGALLVVDEIQVGLGRTGPLWAHEADGVRPDAMTLAKSLGNGIPIGAMLCTEEVARALTPGTHASTFGGNPLACAAAVAAFDLLTGGTLETAATVSRRIEERLRALAGRLPMVREVRGRGMLWGIELSISAPAVVARCREEGVLVGGIGDHVLRLAPPLVLGADDADRGLAAIERAIEAVAGEEVKGV